MPRTRSKPPFSREELLVLMDLKPCALMLYYWLQTCNTAEDEIYLEEFVTFTQTDGRKGYSLRWAKDGFQELVSEDLVSINRCYNSRVFRVSVWKPGEKAAMEAKQTQA
jgi:hypothetical protein